jgi:hypothetical protein
MPLFDRYRSDGSLEGLELRHLELRSGSDLTDERESDDLSLPATIT